MKIIVQHKIISHKDWPSLFSSKYPIYSGSLDDGIFEESEDDRVINWWHQMTKIILK